MAAHLQVLSLESRLCSACVVLTTENSRYVFDVGEGIQRLAIEHKVRIGRICGVFLTSDSYVSVAGLPGELES